MVKNKYLLFVINTVHNSIKSFGMIFEKAIWFIFKYSKFKSILRNDYGITRINSLNPSSWKKNAKYFKAENDSGQKYFVKVVRWGNQIENEYAVLSEIDRLFDEYSGNFPRYVGHLNNEWISFIVVNWIDGCTLDEFLSDNEGLSDNIKNDLYSQLCTILNIIQFIEIVHRDIKPQNFMVEKNGDDLKVILIDFAFAIGCCGNSRNVKLYEVVNKYNPLRFVGEHYKPSVLHWDDAYAFLKISNQYNITNNPAFFSERVNKCYYSIEMDSLD
ncbi:Protein kinase domain-containing protein [Peptoclostridium litorale DSM 5388]|uniref:Protein kinase domain-containing protein n=1 Tax=Peptoclostridium litorale DSM 5388 TaxID=1121324 RepID=A0A069RHA7_PEPLI|nr:protein kinase [Peptoclostridium litorale]KDR96153.1 hypothetical protein CLIT_5c01650 [Peptoclostridium litorale DSM 5388]SIO03448.1 Protein kinase domain-containing protein [Peptoclostridium litorale DSM 5388]